MKWNINEFKECKSIISFELKYKIQLNNDEILYQITFFPSGKMNATITKYGNNKGIINIFDEKSNKTKEIDNN